MREAFDPTAPASLIGDTVVYHGADDQILPFRVDSSSDLGGGIIEYVLVLQQRTADGQALEDHPLAPEVVGYPLDPAANTVADDTLVWARKGVYDSWEFALSGARSLNTQNVDGTAVDATTTDIRANQATGIKFVSVTGPPAYQRLDIDPVTLVSTFTFDVTVDVPSCLSIALTKTYAGTQVGGQNVLTDVTAAITWKTRTVTMLHGTTVGAAGHCVAPTDCCPDGADISICDPPIVVSRTLKVTVSGGPTFNIVCDSFSGQWHGVNGPDNACGDSSAFGLNLTPNCDGTWDIDAVASYRGPANATVTPTSESPFLLTVTAAAESGLCGGTVTFVVSEV